MHFDLEFFLLVATLITGVAIVIDRLRRRATRGRFVEASRALFPVLLVVLVLRSFVVEPFRIPSGSMLPTLKIGDFILVNKFSYGVKLPVFNYKLFGSGKPGRGDIAVFQFPSDPSQDFIKRVVGLPGDLIEYRDKRLFINGKRIKYDDGGRYAGAPRPGTIVASERLRDPPHSILVNRASRGRPNRWRVPPAHYFLMGDNRDNSNDSRAWGFVPEDRLVGKAFMIWMHWDLDCRPFWKVWDCRGEGIDLSRVGDRVV